MMRTWILGIVVLWTAACGAPADQGGYPLPEGLRASVNMAGQTFDLEVARVVGRRATLEYRFGDAVVSSRTQYRGLYSLSGYDGALEFVNHVDTEKIDSLFPLKVGKRTRFAGATEYLGGDITGEMDVSMAVRDRTSVTVGEGDYDVYVIDVITDLSIQGRTKSVKRRLFYAPSLGLPVKMDMAEGDTRSFWRIMSLELPHRGRRNRLGTVMI